MDFEWTEPQHKCTNLHVRNARLLKVSKKAFKIQTRSSKRIFQSDKSYPQLMTKHLTNAPDPMWIEFFNTLLGRKSTWTAKKSQICYQRDIIAPLACLLVKCLDELPFFSVSTEMRCDRNLLTWIAEVCRI